MATANRQDKEKIYIVSFTWGVDYGDRNPGVKTVTFNVINATTKFDALKTAFDKISPIVDGIEPTKMDVRSKDVCE